MEKQSKKITRNHNYTIEEELDLLSEYCDFNLKAMAQKIKLSTYKPKPKMLYL